MAKKPAHIQNTAIADLLRRVGTEINTLRSDDRDAIARAGVALEQTLGELPSELAPLGDVIQVGLEALQGLYMGSFGDAAGAQPVVALLGQSVGAALAVVVRPGEVALVDALGAAKEQLSDGMQVARGNSAESASSLEFGPSEAEPVVASNEAMDAAPEASVQVEAPVSDAVAGPEEAPPGGSPEPGAMSLDDVATLLVQLETRDVAGLGNARAALEQLQGSDALGDGTKRFIVQATRQLAMAEQFAIEGGSDAKTEAGISQAGWLVEAAMNSLEREQAAGAASAPAEVPASAVTNAPVAAAVPVAARVPATVQVAQPGTLVNAPLVAAPMPADAVAKAAAAPAAAAPVAAAPAAYEQMITLPADADADLLSEFINEARDYINGAEAALLELETDSEDSEATNTIFRAFHTIKGTSAFIGLTAITELAHHAESLLSRVREKEIRCTGGYADLALRSVDMLKELIQAVQDVLGGDTAPLPRTYADLMKVLTNPEASGVSAEASVAQDAMPRLGDILVAQRAADRGEVEAVVADQGDQPLGIALVQSNTVSLAEVAKALRTQRRMAGEERTGVAVESSLRVRTDRLDRLIDMVGELVIAQSMVAQDSTLISGAHYALASKITHTGKIVRELQDLSLSMRMVPLKSTFQKMTRLVRDVAHKTGKLVNFVTEGDDTEIDRNMVDVIGDPLVHMVRNAVDHGLELPDVREQQGKTRAGTVRLSAYHSGGNVVVEMSDNGRGLDRERIIQKALAKGLIETDKGLSDTEVFGLIFAPGFSTAEQVTDMSGRGVGMDVVKRSVEALRGRIDVSSVAGKGTTFAIRLPMTLAITDGMVVKVGRERYIIPTASISLSFRPDASTLSRVIGRGELVMLRGELLPLFRMHQLFSVDGATEDPTRALLVVVGEGDYRCALQVDELLGQQQVVAKSLGQYMGRVEGVSGAAILGDGRVGLILDPNALIALARQGTAPGAFAEQAGLAGAFAA